MAGALDADLLKQLAGMVEDDNLIVTYKTLSRKFDISVNHSRHLLDEYFSSRRATFNGTLFAVYSLSGSMKLDDGSVEEQVVFVKEVDLETWQKKLASPKKLVYSIQAMDLEDSASIHLADSPITVDDIRALRSTTSIQCHYVVPRGKVSAVPANFSAPVMTGKGLEILEAESKKAITNIGMSVEAMRVKSSGDLRAGPSAVPKTNTSNKAKSAGTLASWVKSSGLDPKKSTAINTMFEVKREKSASPKKKPPTAAESDDENVFTVRKTKVSANMLDDSDDDVSTSGNFNLDVDMDEAPCSNNQTLMLVDSSLERRSLSPDIDEPVVLRRKSTRAEVIDTEPSHPTKKKDTFSDFVQVSSDEESDRASSPEIVPVKRKMVKPKKQKASDSEPEISVKRKRGKTVKAKPVESDEEDVSNSEKSEHEMLSAKQKNGKAAKPNPVDSDEEESNSGPEKKPPAKRKQRSSRAKKVSEDGEEDSAIPAKTRKPRKKVKKNENEAEEELRQRSPSLEKSELRPFLQTTAVISGKKRKQVTKCSVDEEGYTVTEKVWADVNSDEEAENDKADPITTSIQPKASIANSKVAPTSTTITAALPKTSSEQVSKNKKQNVSNDGKKQVSIMNFFKKA